MVCWLSLKILSFISKFMEISPKMKDVYQYGIEITLSSIFNVILVFLCSLALGDILAGITYLFVFVFLRSFTGGFHATTYLRCNITMVVTFIITFVLYKIVTYFAFPFFICEAIALLNLIPIVIFSPVPNKHKPLTDAQKKPSYNLSIMTEYDDVAVRQFIEKVTVESKTKSRRRTTGLPSITLPTREILFIHSKIRNF